jgi:hypothetical protein
VHDVETFFSVEEDSKPHGMDACIYSHAVTRCWRVCACMYACRLAGCCATLREALACSVGKQGFVLRCVRPATKSHVHAPTREGWKRCCSGVEHNKCSSVCTALLRLGILPSDTIDYDDSHDHRELNVTLSSIAAAFSSSAPSFLARWRAAAHGRNLSATLRHR